MMDPLFRSSYMIMTWSQTTYILSVVMSTTVLNLCQILNFKVDKVSLQNNQKMCIKKHVVFNNLIISVQLNFEAFEKEN